MEKQKAEEEKKKKKASEKKQTAKKLSKKKAAEKKKAGEEKKAAEGKYLIHIASHSFGMCQFTQIYIYLYLIPLTQPSLRQLVCRQCNNISNSMMP